jgi:FkbM family methyltransferase
MPASSYLYTSRFLASSAAVAGIPEKRFTRRVAEAFREIVSRVDPTVTLEVGAFEAGFSRWVREHFADATVLAFEANPYVFDKFKHEVIGLGVDYRNLCIGPENGRTTLKLPGDFDGHPVGRVSQLSSLSNNLLSQSTHEVEVECARLDDLGVAGPHERVVAWIDVEGACEAVLSGSVETLRRSEVVYIEVENRPIWDAQWLDVDVMRYFAEIGMVPIMRDLQRDFQYNLVFVSERLAGEPWVADLAAGVYRPSRVNVTNPERVPHGRLARLQGLFRSSLKAENDALRRQNRRLRKQNRRLRRELG